MANPPAITRDSELGREIFRLVSRGIESSKQLHEQLRGDGLVICNEDGKCSVSQRAIARFLKRERLIDPSGPWSLASLGLSDPVIGAQEASLVLPVLGWAQQISRGRMWLTNGLAKWVARVRTAQPEMPIHWAYSIARAYRSAEIREDADTRCIDLALAIRLWDHPFPYGVPEDDVDIANPWRLVFDGCQKMGGREGQRQLGELQGAWFEGLSITVAVETGEIGERGAARLYGGTAIDSRVDSKTRRRS